MGFFVNITVSGLYQYQKVTNPYHSGVDTFSRQGVFVCGGGGFGGKVACLFELLGVGVVDGLMAACYVFLGYSTFVDFLVFG